MAISLIAVAVFTRLVGVDDYGRFVFVTAVIGTIITALAGWGEYAVLRVVPEIERPTDFLVAVSTLRRLVMRSSAFAAAILVITGFLVVRVGWLPSAFMPYLLPAACVVLVRPTYQTLRTMYQARGEAGRYAVYELVQAALGMVLSVFMVWLLRFGMFGRLWAETTVLAALIWVANRSLLGPEHVVMTAGKPTDPATARRAVRVGLPLAGWFTGLGLMGAIERGILRLLAGDDAVGSYGAIFALIERTSTLAFGPFLMLSFPYLVRIFATCGRTEAGVALGRIMTVFGAWAAAYLILGLGFAEKIIRAVIPHDYLTGLSVVPWLLVAFVLWHFAMYAHKGLELGEKIGNMLWAMGAALSAIALGCIVFVPRFGIAGAGVARVLAALAYLAVVWKPSQAVVPWVFKSVWSSGRVQ
ncbi:MAG: lipopolysaccharide biosynthesis protein [Armatimonadota bacterium]|nr:lipopolysaccharide biosynthesis protein [Armatimonadota bacterium]